MSRDTFIKEVYEKANLNDKYKILFDSYLINLPQETKDNQIELLTQYVSSIDSIRCNYDEIRSIAKNEKLCQEAREAFIKAVYEKADAYYKYKIKFEDCLMDISQETKDSQIELLTQYVSSILNISYEYVSYEYGQIRSIATNVNLCQEAREAFIKVVYEKANLNDKYKILFDSYLINLPQETKDSQIELLTQYVSSIYSISNSYDQIRSIAKNENLCQEARDSFIKIVFEKADIDYKYKILFKDSFVEMQTTQQNLSRTYGTLFNLQMGVNYTQFKNIINRKRITKIIKESFIKGCYEKADHYCKYKILFEDCLIDISKETKDSQIELLTQYVSSIDSISNSYDQIKSIAKNEKLCQ